MVININADVNKQDVRTRLMELNGIIIQINEAQASVRFKELAKREKTLVGEIEQIQVRIRPIEYDIYANEHAKQNASLTEKFKHFCANRLLVRKLDALKRLSEEKNDELMQIHVDMDNAGKYIRLAPKGPETKINYPSLIERFNVLANEFNAISVEKIKKLNTSINPNSFTPIEPITANFVSTSSTERD